MDKDQKNIKELQDIHVKEVSLVDSPAIRRKFIIIKSEVTPMETTNIENNADNSVADEMEVENVQETQTLTTKSEDNDGEKAENDVSEAAVSSEEDTEDAGDVEKSSETEEEIQKAKSMTANRMRKLYEAYGKMGELLKELDPEQKSGHFQFMEDEKKIDSAKPSMFSDKDISKLAAALHALQAKGGHLPEERKKSEQKIEKSADDTQELRETVKQLQKQLSELEATSKSVAEDHTESQEQLKKSTNIWTSII